MATKIIEKINAESLKKDVPAFKIGDGVKVYVKIKEGDKERLQAFIGTVIARDGGGSTETFTVHFLFEVSEVRSDHEAVDFIDIVLNSRFASGVDGDFDASGRSCFSHVGSHEAGRCAGTTDQ